MSPSPDYSVVVAGSATYVAAKLQTRGAFAAMSSALRCSGLNAVSFSSVSSARNSFPKG